MEKNRFSIRFFLFAGIAGLTLFLSPLHCSNLEEIMAANPEALRASIDQDYARATREKWDVLWGRIFRICVAYKIIDPEHTALSDFKLAWQGKNGWFFARIIGSTLIALREMAGLVQDGVELIQLRNARDEIRRVVDLEVAMRRRSADHAQKAQSARNATFDKECDDEGISHTTEDTAQQA